MVTCFSHKDSDLLIRFNKNIVEDTEISWKATGILYYALCRQDIAGGWKFNRADLIKSKTDGRDSVTAGLKELEKTGYLYKVQKQNDKTKKFEGWEYHFFESPITPEQFAEFSKKDSYVIATQTLEY